MGPNEGGETLTRALAAWASRLELDDVPPRVVALAKSQVTSQLAAARAGLAHPLGESLTRAFGRPFAGDPRSTAHVLAALTMALDFDDSVYAGHPSHSTVNVPVAFADALDLDGRALLCAAIAANECAARVTAAATIGPFRGQMAAHPHLVGSVAGRLRAEGAPASRWVDALGLALAMPPWPLVRAFLGSDAKALVAAVPVRMGMDACDAAAAGLRGVPDVLEHEHGFLPRFAEVPLPDAVTAGLGERWHTETLSLKVYPASTGVYASVDCAVELHAALDGAAIEEVVVHGSLFTFETDVHANAYLDGPSSPVSALSYSVRYGVATALLTGGLTPADFAPPAVDDPARWELAARVRVEHDPELSRRAILATAPLGEALKQAGERAAPWVESSGGAALFEADDAAELMRGIDPPSPTFEDAEKAIGARVVVRLADGRELTAARDIATGFAGPDTRARHGELMRAKFLVCGGSAEAADALAALDELDASALARTLEAALA
ncbi:MAG TPA: MmgE/PrpD family protein [Thermoleophilaceae bacterium]